MRRLVLGEPLQKALAFLYQIFEQRDPHEVAGVGGLADV